MRSRHLSLRPKCNNMSHDAIEQYDQGAVVSATSSGDNEIVQLTRRRDAGAFVFTVFTTQAGHSAVGPVKSAKFSAPGAVLATPWRTRLTIRGPKQLFHECVCVCA